MKRKGANRSMTFHCSDEQEHEDGVETQEEIEDKESIIINYRGDDAGVAKKCQFILCQSCYLLVELVFYDNGLLTPDVVQYASKKSDTQSRKGSLGIWRAFLHRY